MKILILGSGGREHALAWAVKRSVRVREVVCAPGNGGIAEIARCLPVDLGDVAAMVQLVEAEQPALTIVGPELPLSLGVVDALQKRGLRVFGPTQAAAKLESSKGFAKRFLQRHNIPTANYAVCTSVAEIERAIEFFHPPVVVKADGLHAGKGVIICDSRHAAIETAEELLSGRLLDKKEPHVLFEEFLEGDEISFLCLSDGKSVVPLAPAQDHKRIGEGDTGPNTGGMGVYSTDAMLDPAMTEWILRHIAEPTVRGMAEEGTPFVGVLYCGLMMTARGPQVLEFNARFGDPETQAILMRLESDLVDALDACVDGKLAEIKLRWTPGAAACVVASSSRLSRQIQDRASYRRPVRRCSVCPTYRSFMPVRLFKTAKWSPPEGACWVSPRLRRRWMRRWPAPTRPSSWDCTSMEFTIATTSAIVR